MRIGLIRHFKVKKMLPEKRFVAPDEITQWFNEYDTAEIEDGQIDLCGFEWKTCFSSDLFRAVSTAEKIHGGSIIKKKELREFPLDEFCKRNIKLPFLAWAFLFRLKTLFPNKVKADFKKQISDMIDEILMQNEEDLLIVSHGFVMIFMRKALMKRGFKGPNFRTPANGKLYIYERN